MITFIHLLKRLIRHHQLSPVPDTLLRDIGVSKMLVDFQ